MATSEEVQHYLISEFDADYGTDGKTMFIAHPSEHAFGGLDISVLFLDESDVPLIRIFGPFAATEPDVAGPLTPVLSSESVAVFTHRQAFAGVVEWSGVVGYQHVLFLEDLQASEIDTAIAMIKFQVDAARATIALARAES